MKKMITIIRSTAKSVLGFDIPTNQGASAPLYWNALFLCSFSMVGVFWGAAKLAKPLTWYVNPTDIHHPLFDIIGWWFFKISRSLCHAA